MQSVASLVCTPPQSDQNFVNREFTDAFIQNAREMIGVNVELTGQVPKIESGQAFEVLHLITYCR